MLRLLVASLLVFTGSFAFAQNPNLKEAPWGFTHGDKPSSLLILSDKKSAQVTLSIKDLGQRKPRPADSLYCLSPLERRGGRPENGGTYLVAEVSDMKRMHCGKPEAGGVRITFRATEWKTGKSGTYGFLPLTVYPKGELFVWEALPEGSPMVWVTYMHSERWFIALHVEKDGTVRAATREEAKAALYYSLP